MGKEGTFYFLTRLWQVVYKPTLRQCVLLLTRFPPLRFRSSKISRGYPKRGYTQCSDGGDTTAVQFSESKVPPISGGKDLAPTSRGERRTTPDHSLSERGKEKGRGAGTVWRHYRWRSGTLYIPLHPLSRNPRRGRPVRSSRRLGTKGDDRP